MKISQETLDAVAEAVKDADMQPLDSKPYGVVLMVPSGDYHRQAQAAITKFLQSREMANLLAFARMVNEPALDKEQKDALLPFTQTEEVV